MNSAGQGIPGDPYGYKSDTVEYAYPTISKKVVLSHCPFCNTDMSIMNGRVWHPPFDCILKSFSFEDSAMNIQMWNKRVNE